LWIVTHGLSHAHLHVRAECVASHSVRAPHVPLGPGTRAQLRRCLAMLTKGTLINIAEQAIGVGPSNTAYERQRGLQTSALVIAATCCQPDLAWRCTARKSSPFPLVTSLTW
jgi:hypothetical protein